MNQTYADIQSEFLHAPVANQTPIWVFPVNGIALTDVIATFDQYVLSVDRVQKNAVVLEESSHVSA